MRLLGVVYRWVSVKTFGKIWRQKDIRFNFVQFYKFVCLYSNIIIYLYDTSKVQIYLSRQIPIGHILIYNLYRCEHALSARQTQRTDVRWKWYFMFKLPNILVRRIIIIYIRNWVSLCMTHTSMTKCFEPKLFFIQPIDINLVFT